ncbi:hypothetical protein [Emticicia agri]|uniref:Uncharacterized protein n=1 Tax=Emticicia agri TaxID=2492393 RepID=A0A4Q5LVV0_9BACT|nr:hypothetical protein [Emticicia agri]RYU93812.1 hypothetical protein EWM59_20030 [Emticicia agri]
MALKSAFAQADIKKVLDASLRNLRTEILQSMKKSGEESVRIARANADTIDASGKLAQSVGYVIVADGVIVAREFDRSADKPVEEHAANSSDSGQQATTNEALAGEKLAESLAAQYSKGYALIVVSGSAYAVEAESRSQDVLTSAEMYVGQQLPKLLERLTQS